MQKQKLFERAMWTAFKSGVHKDVTFFGIWYVFVY